MNQVEPWFNILHRKRLQSADFASKDQLQAQIEQLIVEWNQQRHPFNCSPKSVANAMAEAPTMAACYGPRHRDELYEALECWSGLTTEP